MPTNRHDAILEAIHYVRREHPNVGGIEATDFALYFGTYAAEWFGVDVAEAWTMYAENPAEAMVDTDSYNDHGPGCVCDELAAAAADRKIGGSR